jgi:uncharacterized repeat protein (TIGR01451 family)
MDGTFKYLKDNINDIKVLKWNTKTKKYESYDNWCWVNKDDMNNKIDVESVDENSRLKINVGELKGNESLSFGVKITYSTYCDKTINNEVQIENTTTPSNNTKYRTYDGDTIIMKKYSVSLEKYVSKVESADSIDHINVSGREGKRYNCDANSDEDKDTWKINNPYKIENGDFVTYTIKVENTGETPVKITKIKDLYTNMNDRSNANKMICKGITSVKKFTNSESDGSSDGVQAIITYYKENGNETVENDGEKDLNEKAINLKSSYIEISGKKTTLDKNEYILIEIKFQIYSTSKDYEEASFMNRAKIVEIKDKDDKTLDISIWDSDGTGNNQDEDHVVLKPYRVSLEKFVTKVTDKTDNNEVRYTENNKYTREGYGYEQYYLRGDVNGDGDVDLYDVNDILWKAENGKTILDNLDNENLLCAIADLNDDGNIDLTDARLAKRIEEELDEKTYYYYDAEGKIQYSSTSGKEKNTYKINNPVPVEDGDKITYTIKLTNTGDSSVKITQIDDWHDKELKLCESQSNITVEKKSLTHDIITLAEPKLLKSGESTYVEIQYQINAGKSNNKKDFYNKAKIITDTLENKNGYKAWDCDGTDNNQDEDHIKLKEYKVSLEKFVTKVTDADGNNAQSYTDREYRRYNESAITTANKNEFKKNNVVEVEAGDKVTFTIKLKNEETTESEKNTTIYIKEITDIPVSKNGNSLDYINNSISIGATVEEENGNYKVIFKEPIKITAQNSFSFTMTFYVNVKVSNTASVQEFSNKAQINTIYNRNDIEVNDSDGTDNNIDQDFIKTKTYAVSLEKYIEKVVTSKGYTNDALNRDGLAEHKYDNDPDTNTPDKYNNVVEADNGSEITYVIKINNDGNTNVKFVGVQDWLPNETIKYTLDSKTWKTNLSENRNIYIVNVRSAGKYNDGENETLHSYNTGSGITLKPGETKEFKVTIKTNASNLSLDTYTNKATIEYIQNRNDIDIIDTTQYDNTDYDYFKMNSSKSTPTSVRVFKEWVGYAEDEKFEVEVGLYENGKLKDRQKLNKNNAWTYVWKNLNRNAKYTVKELTTGNFDTKIESISDVTWKITNSKKVQPDKTKVTVIKDWKDEDNKAGRRPNSVTVALYRNGIQQGGEVTLNNRNSWKNTWNNLDKYDEDGNEYVYTVKEIKIPDGYTSSISFSTGNNVTTIKVTNTYTSEKVSKTVIKKWEDENNKYGNRPTSIKVGLYAGNTRKEIVTLNSSNSWSHTWNNLDKYSNGKEIVYTVKELDANNNPVNDLKTIGNYMVKYDFSTEYDVITNIYNKTDLSVYKKWNVENESLIKPVEITLYQNNNKHKKITLNSSNSWYYKWENLPKYDDKGEEYRYTIKEATLENIESRIYKISENEYKLVNEEIIDQDCLISGIVWNDVAFDKTSTNYNGKYDQGSGKDSLLKDIKVYLYRNGVNDAVAETTTDSNGYYCFRNIDLKNVSPTEKYIKAKVNSETDNKWDETSGYYSYTVVFEYDGIKYTSTFDSTGQRIWGIDGNSTVGQYATSQYSNAQEKESDRKNLNNRFSTINNESGINYETINEENYLPQSRYKYNNSTMSITSSTNTINIADYKDKELKLQHVNLGLRGRDTLDLELTSDVYSVDVTVNNQTGTYYYNNEVTITKNDIGVHADAAHITNESRKAGYDKLNQKVRSTDINNEAYGNTGLGINVTYKITVLNASVTNGTATKIVNYYDNRYEFINAKYNGNELSSENINGGNGYSGRLITTNGDMLTNSKSMDIYVTYKLKDPVGLLSNVSELPTYNMAEIYEYKSECANGQSEYTRGLIDVDSAPGSANTEKARLKGNKTDNNTTVQYFFNANNLDQLKYEDDTYATPVLYFVKDDSKRKLSGNVFEDLTTVNAEKVKTGNGIKDSNEINVYGATVELLENGTELRYSTTTDTEGNYSFEGFLPGNYMVRFRYGDTDNTVMLDINPKSFNGEDYQATNNTGTYGANKISNRANYWYLDNEEKGISTAADNTNRRSEVSDNVYNNPNIMQTLNDIRAGKSREQCVEDNVNSLIEKTNMNASTQNILIGVEKAYLENDIVKQSNRFEDYEIKNLNFGIAEVPVSTIDLQKHVDELEIVDSAGINTIAKIKLQDDGKYKVDSGEVLAAGANEPIDVSIENEKLQGAKLRITYVITANINAEKNFDGGEVIRPSINGLVDFIDNNLEYNSALGENLKYWKLISFDDMQTAYKGLWETGDSFTPASTVVNNANTHKVIIEATEDNPILKLKDGATSVKLVLEKVLSSNDSGIEGIEMETQNMFGYGNIIEIKGLTYNTPDGQEGGNPLRDRVRTTDRYIIVPGGSRDTATSEEIVIHPPTGDGGAIGITYYIVGLASLCILAIGVFGIKKFIIKR